MNLEVLEMEIKKIYNIKKQICLNGFKKTREFRKMGNYRSSVAIKHKNFEIGINVVKM